MAATLADQAILKAEPSFISRVGAALVAACVAARNEAITTATESLHARRSAFAVTVLNNPTPYQVLFAGTVATDATVSTAATGGGTYVALTAGNVAAQQALATDASIANAVSSQYNSYFLS